MTYKTYKIRLVYSDIYAYRSLIFSKKIAALGIIKYFKSITVTI